MIPLPGNSEWPALANMHTNERRASLKITIVLLLFFKTETFKSHNYFLDLGVARGILKIQSKKLLTRLCNPHVSMSFLTKI